MQKLHRNFRPVHYSHDSLQNAKPLQAKQEKRKLGPISHLQEIRRRPKRLNRNVFLPIS